MPTPNRNRRPGARPSPRHADDEVMELNTGDVIPLFDEDIEGIEILRDDAPQRSAKPVLMTPSLGETTAIRRPKADPQAPLETQIIPSLAAREQVVSEPGYSATYLYVEKGPGAGQLVPVLQGEMVLGRASSSQIELDHPSVSRQHAALSRRGEQYFLRDLGSQNGTYVNWARIQGEVEVYAGDQIAVGSAVLVVRGGLYTHGQRRGSTPSAPGPSKVLMGLVFGIAASIGLAAVYFVDSHKIPARHSALRELSAPAEQASDAPVEMVKPAEIEPQPTEAAPDRTAGSVVLAAEAHHVRVQHHASTAPAKASSKPVASAGDAAPRDVLKIYESGDLSAAIAAANAAHAPKVAAAIQQLKQAYEAGKTALASRNGGAAIASFARALKLDESIDQGWGKLNQEIRGELAKLYLLAGNQALARGDEATAKKAFKAAQGYDPANAEVRRQLQSLTSGSGDGSAPSNARSAADAAFDG